MANDQKTEIAFERVLFFSDAVVAIAITLLALELKIEAPKSGNLTFADLLAPWHKYLPAAKGVIIGKENYNSAD